MKLIHKEPAHGEIPELEFTDTSFTDSGYKSISMSIAKNGSEYFSLEDQNYYRLRLVPTEDLASIDLVIDAADKKGIKLSTHNAKELCSQIAKQAWPGATSIWNYPVVREITQGAFQEISNRELANDVLCINGQSYGGLGYIICDGKKVVGFKKIKLTADNIVISDCISTVQNLAKLDLDELVFYPQGSTKAIHIGIAPYTSGDPIEKKVRENDVAEYSLYRTNNIPVTIDNDRPANIPNDNLDDYINAQIQESSAQKISFEGFDMF